MDTDAESSKFGVDDAPNSVLERLAEKYDPATWSGIDDEVDKFLSRELRSDRQPKPPRKQSERSPKRSFLDDESERARIWGVEFTCQGWSQDSERHYLARISELEQLSDSDLFNLCGDIEAGVLAQAELESLLALGGRNARHSETARDLHQIGLIGHKAFERVTNANLRLVAYIARKYQGLGLELMDLIQWGNLGLIRAVQKFDRERGFKFSTYAFNWIEQSVRRGISEQSRLIRVPDHAFWRVESILSDVRREELEISIRQLLRRTRSKFQNAFPTGSEQIMHTSMPIQSLNAPARYFDVDLAPQASWENLVDDFEVSPDQIADLMILERQLGWILEFLPEPLGAVLRMRFGIEGEAKTLEEIGAIFGLTRERIRQLQNKAFSIIEKDYDYLDEFEG